MKSWLISLVIALLIAVAGAVASGYVAALAVDWYHVPGREGASGYFVVGLGLVGGVVGGIIGLVVSRIVAAGTGPVFLKALGMSLAVLLAIVGGIGGAARLLADVPPEIDGETLLLAVEVRWPAEQTTSPAAEPGDGTIRLHSIPLFSNTVRASATGPLWKEDAHLVGGRWVVPGAVSIFTGRGQRMLEIVTGEKKSEAFLVPLPGRPGARDLQWSDWLPRLRPGAPAPTSKLTYRYRAQKVSEPARTETIGPFEVATIAGWFDDIQMDGRTTIVAPNADLKIRFRGQPLIIEGKTSSSDETTTRFERIGAVAALPGPEPAMLVQAESDAVSGSAICWRTGASNRASRT